MDVMSIITYLVGLLGSIPVVGHFLAIALPVAAALPIAVSAFVALWHAVVMMIAALAGIPGLQGLKNIADSMKAKEDNVSSFANGKLLPLLNRISAIPLPKAPSSDASANK